jgi:hypothetical protein
MQNLLKSSQWRRFLACFWLNIGLFLAYYKLMFGLFFAYASLILGLLLVNFSPSLGPPLLSVHFDACSSGRRPSARCPSSRKPRKCSHRRSWSK